MEFLDFAQNDKFLEAPLQRILLLLLLMLMLDCSNLDYEHEHGKDRKIPVGL
jgi:hypothetical protein